MPGSQTVFARKAALPASPCLGSDWPPLHFPDSGAFIFDAAGMNYVHTPLNTDLMRGFLFLLLALAFNGF